MENDFFRIVKHYGVLNQARHFHEENYELIEAMFDYEYADHSGDSDYEERLKEHIAEEIADNLNFLKQFQLYYGIEDEVIEDIREFKNKRTLERIVKWGE